MINNKNKKMFYINIEKSSECKMDQNMMIWKNYAKIICIFLTKIIISKMRTLKIKNYRMLILMSMRF